MSSIRKIFKNLVINFSSAIVVSLLSLAFTVIIARYLGSASYGIFSYALAYINIFIVVNDFGLITIAVRDVSKDPNKTQEYFSTIFTSKVILACIFFVISLCMAPFLIKDPVNMNVLLLFTISGFIYMFQLSYRWLFQAHMVLEYEALLNVLQGILSVLLVLLVIYLKKGLLAIACLWIVMQLIVAAVGVLSAHRIVKFKLAFDLDLIKKILPASLVVGGVVVVSTVYLYLDKVILFQIKGPQEVGLYSAASKILLFIRSLVFLYFPVAFPAFSSFSVNMHDKNFHKFLTRSFYYILMLTSAIALGGTILASNVITLVFGAGYISAVPALKIIMWALPLTCLSGLISWSFIGSGRQKESLYVGITGLIINVLLNLCFIWKYGYYASSAAVVISEVIMFTGYVALAYKMLEFRLSFAKLTQITLSLCLMGFFLLNYNAANLIFSIVLGGALYLVSLVIFRAVNQEDWALLKKIILKQI
jgi:O-antigen/teichoic acid export membrane protein